MITRFWSKKFSPMTVFICAVSYKSAQNGNGDADFFFEQRDTVIFILYFVTTAYTEMQPTWDEIIQSYSVDAEAALAAAPAPADDTQAAPTAPRPSQPSRQRQQALLPGRQGPVHLYKQYQCRLCG